jgi:hypothetical protein
MCEREHDMMEELLESIGRREAGRDRLCIPRGADRGARGSRLAARISGFIR